MKISSYLNNLVTVRGRQIRLKMVQNLHFWQKMVHWKCDKNCHKNTQMIFILTAVKHHGEIQHEHMI